MINRPAREFESLVVEMPRARASDREWKERIFLSLACAHRRVDNGRMNDRRGVVHGGVSASRDVAPPRLRASCATKAADRFWQNKAKRNRYGATSGDFGRTNPFWQNQAEKPN